jgi:hypothetical protein
MGDSSDRRAMERMPVNAGTACSFAAPILTDLGTVKIRDVSLEGIGLVLVRRVEAGTLLVIGLENPDKNIMKTMIVQVAHVTPITGGFLIGGTFEQPLTYQEFTALVM